jgi:exopolysaccharide biosynthesis polyprenyl glycosylphosphotransferase
VKRAEIIAGIAKIFFDFFCVIFAWFLSYKLRPYTDLIPFTNYDFTLERMPYLGFFIPFVIYSAIGSIVLFALLNFYKIGKKYDWAKELFQIILGVFLWGMLIVSYFALVRHDLVFSRVMLYQAMLFSTVLIFIYRVTIRLIMIWLWKIGKLAKKVVLFGEGEMLKNLSKSILNTSPFVLAATIDNNNIDELKKIALKNEINEIWQVSSNLNSEQNAIIREIAAEKHLDYRFVPSDISMQIAKMNMEMIDGIPVVHPVQSNLEGWGRVVKRNTDIFASALFLLLFFWLYILIALLIKIDSKGAIFYVQKRVGIKGREFSLIKFRSMIKDADKKKEELLKESHRDGPLFKIKDDPRVTRIGKFLRRFSLDELPQFFNVLKGNMSIVGPRPHLEEEIENFTVWQKQILNIRPGLTGLSQVSGRSDLPFKKEIELDLYFIQNWSFFLEIKIFFRTIWVVISGRGAD